MGRSDHLAQVAIQIINRFVKAIDSIFGLLKILSTPELYVDDSFTARANDLWTIFKLSKRSLKLVVAGGTFEIYFGIFKESWHDETLPLPLD